MYEIKGNSTSFLNSNLGELWKVREGWAGPRRARLSWVAPLLAGGRRWVAAAWRPALPVREPARRAGVPPQVREIGQEGLQQQIDLVAYKSTSVSQ
jgi:hypothetical protein